jgi:putative sporulation protein YtxC
VKRLKLISIVFHDWTDCIEDKMRAEIDFFAEKDIFIKEQIDVLKDGVFVTYFLDDKTIDGIAFEHFLNLFQYRMANVLSDILLQDITEKFIQILLKQQYGCFDPYERKLILEHFQENEKNRISEFHIKNPDGETDEKLKIIQHLNHYLLENSFIHLEGFFRFRLKDYRIQLENRIDQAVEDFLIEKEYNEFIKILRYFVELQEPKIETIHLFMDDEEKYLLYDQEGRMINNEDLEDLSEEIKEKDMNKDDLLISSLITLAPANLVIHFSKQMENKEIIETIRKVFFEKISVCYENNICVPVKNLKQE